jgi:GT2 family glycosyltransferase
MHEDPAGSSAAPLRLAIGIPTCGRPSMIAETLRDIAQQTRQPDRVLVCATNQADVESPEGVPAGVEILFARSGLPHQRNAILDRLDDCDIVLFLDDDFLMAPRYVEATVAAMQSFPGLVVTTGRMIADDSRGPGLSVAEGRAMIAAEGASELDSGLEKAPHGYGCNMALRLAAIRAHGERFDERLPLYAWSEDIDFTHRLARHGWIAKLHGARGVHLGAKQGRSPGRRLGYSQVANPIYLFRKGSYSFGRAARSVGRNLAANAAKSVQPEPYIDRRGRLRGNGLAFLDLLRGRLAPERILEL